jgi:hypothetical protein
MLKRDVDFWSDVGRRKGHTHLVVVFDTALRREHHRFVPAGESVDATVDGIKLERFHEIVQVVKLS